LLSPPPYLHACTYHSQLFLYGCKNYAMVRPSVAQVVPGPHSLLISTSDRRATRHLAK
jgi:hypothetical protein